MHATVPRLSGLDADVDARVRRRNCDAAVERSPGFQRLTHFTIEHEPELRTMLWLSLGPEPAHHGDLLLRRGRAIAWIDDALAPLRGKMPESDLRRLVFAIRSAVGIEALVWLTDIARLSREHAVGVMDWSARALLQFALVENGASGTDAPTNTGG